MKALTTVITTLFVSTIAQAASICPTATLNTYTGSNFACTESSGQITATWNDGLIPSYIGLNVLSANNSAAAPSSITVNPENLGFDFTSSAFSETTSLLSPISAQAEVVHFLLDSGTQDIDSVKLSLDNAQVSAGVDPLLGVGAIVGQEVLCLGGEFTSLPVGLVTSIVGNSFGCTGVAVMGSAGARAGLLSNITGLILPVFAADNVTIDLSSFNVHEVDVIKLQALVGVAGGSASDTGFGNTYTLSGSSSSATPEPGSSMMMLAAGVLLAGNKFIVRLFKGRRTE
jgi:hypothetical protein